MQAALSFLEGLDSKCSFRCAGTEHPYTCILLSLIIGKSMSSLLCRPDRIEILPAAVPEGPFGAAHSLKVLLLVSECSMPLEAKHDLA